MTEENHTSIHAEFQRLTNRDVAMTMMDHHRWNDFRAHGWTEADLGLVVAFIKGRIKERRRYDESLRLHNLIDPARFADDLADARAELRQRPTARAKALASIGRQEPERQAVRADHVLERTKLAQMLKDWRQAND